MVAVVPWPNGRGGGRAREGGSVTRPDDGDISDLMVAVDNSLAVKREPREIDPNFTDQTPHHETTSWLPLKLGATSLSTTPAAPSARSCGAFVKLQRASAAAAPAAAAARAAHRAAGRCRGSRAARGDAHGLTMTWRDSSNGRGQQQREAMVVGRTAERAHTHTHTAVKERYRPSRDSIARAGAPLLTRAVVVAACASGRIVVVSSGCRSGTCLWYPKDAHPPSDATGSRSNVKTALARRSPAPCRGHSHQRARPQPSTAARR